MYTRYCTWLKSDSRNTLLCMHGSPRFCSQIPPAQLKLNSFLWQMQTMYVCMYAACSHSCWDAYVGTSVAVTATQLHNYWQIVNNANALTFTRRTHTLTNTLVFPKTTSQRCGRVFVRRNNETLARKSRKTMMSDEWQGKSPDGWLSFMAPSSPAGVGSINVEKLNATKLKEATIRCINDSSSWQIWGSIQYNGMVTPPPPPL